MLIYPVYALDAPAPVYEWISGVSEGNGLSTAVISVSGGGEMWPNTVCRVGCIKLFERKSYNVFYERMLVMPSNILTETKEQLAVRLLKILPSKVKHCVEEILTGKRRRKRPSITIGILSIISKMEKKGGRK